MGYLEDDTLPALDLSNAVSVLISNDFQQIRHCIFNYGLIIRLFRL